MFIRMIQVYVGSDPEVFVWYGMRYEQVCVRYDPSECEVIDPSVCVVWYWLQEVWSWR